MQSTTIRVKRDTKRLLDMFGRKNTSYDDILRTLMKKGRKRG